MKPRQIAMISESHQGLKSLRCKRKKKKRQMGKGYYIKGNYFKKNDKNI